MASVKAASAMIFALRDHVLGLSREKPGVPDCRRSFWSLLYELRCEDGVEIGVLSMEMLDRGRPSKGLVASW